MAWNSDTKTMYHFGGFSGENSLKDVYTLQYLGNDQWENNWKRAGQLQLARDSGRAIYHNGAFYLMGGFRPNIQTEVWKSPLEKKLLPRNHNFNRYSFSILS